MSDNSGTPSTNAGSNTQTNAADTASIMSSSSTSPLIRNKKKGQGKDQEKPEIDVKKFQEEAMKNQIRFCM